MRNLLALVGLAVVVFAGVGYARGWYSFSVSPGKDGRTDLNLSVDTKKVGSDVQDGASRAGSAIDEWKKANPAPPPTTGTAAAAPAAGLPAPPAGGR